MRYKFKSIQELYWAVLITIVVTAAPTLMTLDPDTIKDWRSWLIGFGVGILRPVVGVTLNYVREAISDHEDETSPTSS